MVAVIPVGVERSYWIGSKQRIVQTQRGILMKRQLQVQLKDISGKMKDMDYKKFYNLEEYLFREVGPLFRETSTLSVEDFFCIVIWKANRAKTNIKKKLSKTTTLSESIRQIISDLVKAKEPEEKLDILVKKWKFGLPMATAILTVLYPKEFTVYDYRVREQLGLSNIYSVKKYFKDFLPMVKKYADSRNESLRESDKELWGKSFFGDLQKLIK